MSLSLWPADGATKPEKPSPTLFRRPPASATWRGWSLLVVRDLLFKGRHEFKDYLAAKEKIATNVLSDRLRRLEENGTITKAVHPTDARRVDYRLTEKGLDLAPLLFEMAHWATKHEETEASAPLLRRMSKDRENLLVELRANHPAEQS